VGNFLVNSQTLALIFFEKGVSTLEDHTYRGKIQSLSHVLYLLYFLCGVYHHCSLLIIYALHLTFLFEKFANSRVLSISEFPNKSVVAEFFRIELSGLLGFMDGGFELYAFRDGHLFSAVSYHISFY
jgi:hypothetical protein